MRKVAIQGIRGCYHDLAARQFFPNQEIDLMECLTFEQVFESIQTNPEVIGVLAIENTIAGSLLHNHELLRLSDTCIIGEHKLRISHCVACLPTDSLASLRVVQSHPVALMQCRTFFEQYPLLESVESIDTALSAKNIAQQKLHQQATICSTYAAELYGLKVIKKAIESDTHNFTRFLIVQSKDSTTPIQPASINKASLVFTLPHRCGSLSTILSVLSFYDMNLTKIQSLPIVGKEWQYQFFIDVIFTDKSTYVQGLNAIEPLTSHLKILGEYEEGE